MSVLKSKFDPKLCCAHEWEEHGVIGQPCETYEVCTKCGSYCKRDAGGAIVSYAAHGLRDAS